MTGAETPTDDLVVRAFLHALIVPTEDEGSWAANVWRDLSWSDPLRAWHILSEVICRAPADRLSDLGLGELETFLHSHGVEFVGQIEQRAGSNPNFRIALSSVWLTKGALPQDIEDRLQHASRNTMTIVDLSGE